MTGYNNYKLRKLLYGKYGASYIGKAADDLMINRVTFSKKLSGKADWKDSEITNLATLLNIETDNIGNIFFKTML